MAFPTIFSQLAAGQQPFSLLDTMFNIVAGMGTVFCAASGNNSIVLTANTNQPAFLTYNNYQAFGFVAVGTSSGPITINYQTIGARNAYAPDGATQLGSGALIVGTYYIFAFNSALNSGAGGFQILSVPSGGTALVASSINGGQLAGLRNRIINGDMRIDQRNSGSSQTITASASAAYTVDRFYATCTGANVAGRQVAGTGVDQYVYQFAGAASVTGIHFGQCIEATNIYDLEGTTATLSVELANSLLTTVTWTAYYPTAADNWTARTQIATGTFTVNSTLTKYSASIALGANVTAGLEIELSVGAQISGVWTIGEFQLENGTSVTPFERRPIGMELLLAQRYYSVLLQAQFTGGSGNFYQSFTPPATLRTTPSTSLANTSYSSASSAAVNYANASQVSLYASGSGGGAWAKTDVLLTAEL